MRCYAGVALVGADPGIEAHVEHADHHLVEALLTPDHRLGRVRILRVILRIVEALGTLEFRALGHLDGVGEIVPELPVPGEARHVQQGLALAVGILVDDATVEIENTNRNIAMKKPIVKAILDGAAQIATPTLIPQRSTNFCDVTTR